MAMAKKKWLKKAEPQDEKAEKPTTDLPKRKSNADLMKNMYGKKGK